MHKPILTVAAVGALGFAIWKVLSFLLLPLVGTVLGWLFALLKIALVVGLVFLVLRWLSRDKKKDGEASTS